MYKLSIPLALSLLLLGCQSKDPLAEKEFYGACWDFTDSLTFTYTPKADTLGLGVDLELEDAYAFSNLNLRLKVRYPSGKDTLLRHSQTFIDPLGNWQVERKRGSYLVSFSGFAHLPTPDSGSYQMTLQHDMREDRLCGVYGVRVAAGSW